MASRAIKPVSVTLGRQMEGAQGRVASGQYSSLSEVVRAGLRALDREDRILDESLRGRIDASLSDTRPASPQAEVFAALRAHHGE